jgi:hypothetical protein
MDSDQVVMQEEISQIHDLQRICHRAVASPGRHKVCVRERKFEEEEFKGFDDYAIGIALAKLHKEGYRTDTKTEMDSVSIKHYIIIDSDPIQLKAKAEKL